MNFDQAFDILIGHEGGYSNNPRDPGGETMWGITFRVARAHGYYGPMRYLPRSTAKDIYRKAYWSEIRADELPDALRFDLFDTAVNSGVAQAAKFLQRAVGVPDDGIIGPQTLAAVRDADPQLIDKRFNGHRLRFMADLKAWPDFARGWARRIAHNLIED
jgi:lysozyme family protein